MRFFTSLTLLLSLTLTAHAAEIQLLPNRLKLNGPEARHRLVVQQSSGQTLGAQVTEEVEFETADSEVAEVVNGVIHPRGNGSTTVTASVGDATSSIEVTVSGMDQPFTWSFRNHVQSVLSKSGCNQGACHGAAQGKNGFYLSLRGYDPEFDFWSITRQARGRRIIPSDPGRSLLLTKPTGMVPHKGGVRFDEESLEYRVLAEWIAAGQPEPTPEDPRITELEILPKQIVVKPGVTQQFLIRAHFSDGHVEDVTQWAKFSSTNSSVAEIDKTGHADIKGHGEGAIVAWYLGQNVVGLITSPYEQTVPEHIYASRSENLIDKHVNEKLQKLNIPPSPLCSDSEFIRRVFLDTLGILPTEEETRTFLMSEDAGKRHQLIDKVLKRPEFVDYWTYRWSDLFLLSGERLRPKALDAFSKWIREQVEQNTPWDEFARKVILATGSSYENGAVNFYTLHQDPLDTAETVSMAFMGMAINCARCHDHPLEKWTNNDYYGMANLFSRVRAKGWGGDFRNGDGKRDVYVVERGELIQPRLGKPQPPRPLQGEPVSFDSTDDRREHLVEWLIDDDNPYFSKAIANRIWANFLGVGIVENVDDLRLTNPPSNQELFDALAAYLESEDYNLKSLMRLILQSETYQRSSQFIAGNEADERFYSHYYPRRLKAEVLLDAVSQVLDAPTKFDGYDEGTRALQLKDVNISSYFLDAFGRPERLATCECERSDEPSMVQVLHLVNGDTLNQKLAQEKNWIGHIVDQKLSDETIVDSAYLRAFSRFPTSQERIEILTVLSQTSPSERRQMIEDLYWSLLSSREFLFQH
ncbi:MAG: DUF1553 domain-containing protein [Planctomycetaceae bacterium]|nr:DUF1553 domain-containing protein [Planctomycetaceae bacterium]